MIDKSNYVILNKKETISNYNEKTIINYKVKIIILGFLVGILLVIIKLFFIQFSSREELLKELKMSGIKEISTLPIRGAILDRNNRIIAESARVYDLFINPSKINIEDASLIKTMSKHLNIDALDLLFEIKLEQNKNKQSMLLAKNIASPKKNQILNSIKNLGKEDLIKKKIIILGGKNEKGYYEEHFPKYKRFYPYGESTAPLIGLNDFEHIIDFNKKLDFKFGIERFYDDYLNEKVYSDKVKTTLRNIPISFRRHSTDYNKNDLHLTLDINKQQIFYNALKVVVNNTQADYGAGILIDAFTGEILSMVSYPSFNPNNRNYANSLTFSNKTISKSFEIGSTMKPLIVLEALNKGVINVNDLVKTSKTLLIHNQEIKEANHIYSFGAKPIDRVIIESINIGIATIALRLKNFINPFKFFDRLGLTDTTLNADITLPDYVKKNMKITREFNDFDFASASYGYGFKSTILNLAYSYMPIANGGYKQNLNLIQGKNNIKYKKIYSKKHIDFIRKAMRKVFTDPYGTAFHLNSNNIFKVAGKTGTVEISEVVDGVFNYDTERYNSIFVGIAPYDNPKYLGAVIVSNPKGKVVSGGKIAAPVFLNVINKIYLIDTKITYNSDHSLRFNP